MKTWFSSLEERERLFVVAAAAVVLLAIFWFGLWMPLDRGQRTAANSVETLKSSLAALRPLRGQIRAADAGRPNQANQNQSLVVIVDNTLRQHELYASLQRSQPTPAGNGIRVELENAAFDDLMLWLGAINSQFGLHVQSGSFSKASDKSEGRVNSSLTLER